MLKDYIGKGATYTLNKTISQIRTNLTKKMFLCHFNTLNNIQIRWSYLLGIRDSKMIK